MVGKFRFSALILVAALAVQFAAVSPAASQANRSTGTQVYLLRGLMNIFSLGMDDLAQKINARGVRASVHNHAEWQSLSDQIAARYRAGNRSPVILIGHSLGADAVMMMGEYLDRQNVPVALIVPFDGTASHPASKNVARVFNLTQRTYARMTRGPGFRGELVNMDVSGPNIDHINIDKSARLHSLVIARVLAVAGRGGGAASAAKPTSEAPAAAGPGANSHATATGAKPAAVQ